ncbi:DUF1294 domain-containing protein [Ornithinicoccus halotolerans]|uniref:DUF1294 domain-containing protein n=1 Tax=Ornithinicoccus halotolerans TaxID=1748220 RepID=UPI00129688B9|nr:DUF1294 domain-containing protein [Ornithinicoccus halotolerans]
MRQQGRVQDWNDARGFGFIAPEGGGQRIFVHISAFPRGQRPVTDERVSYVQSRDGRSRPRASEVRYVGVRQARPRTGRGLGAVASAATFFLGLVAALVVLGFVPTVFLAAYLVLSAASFGLYRADKAAARRGQRRVPESTLHALDLLGGWPGGLVARHAFRHKTTKQPFRTVFWVTVLANCAAFTWLMLGLPVTPS